MLQVGMKALIIGARTEAGQQFIGWEVTLEQEVVSGVDITVGVYSPRVARVHDESGGFVVARDGISSKNSDFKPGFALFSRKHLMPIPPLEDPGIDECTFTPIIQKEHA